MSHVERVLVAGANGATGREILQELRGRGPTVRAMTTSPEAKDRLRRLGADEVVLGDLLDADDARRVVRDVDAVLCAVGSSPRDWFSRRVVDGKGVINLIDAAAAEGVRRFVTESAIGVGDSKPGMAKPFRYLLIRSLKGKERAENYLRHAGLSYTIVRPGRLTNDPPTGDVLVGEGGDTVSGTVPRADVAHLLIAALYTPESSNRTFEVVSRDGQKGEARGLVSVDWRTEPRPVGEVDAVGETRLGR